MELYRAYLFKSKFERKPTFSSIKLLTSPLVQMAGGSPVELVTVPIEPNNAPVKPDRRRSSENDTE